MPVSTRKSLARAPDGHPESSGQDVTEIMNELASVAPETPSRKRPRRSSIMDGSKGPPNKMLAVEILHPASAQSTPGRPSPRKTSGRLKARTSLPARTPATRRTEWDIPADDVDGTGKETRMEPVKKLVPLAKPKPLQKSPFKGRGIIQTRSSARVNLDDSPAKPEKTKDLSKITKSLQKVGRPKRKLARPPTPGLGLKPDPPPARSQSEFSPLKADRKSASRKSRHVPTSAQPNTSESVNDNSVAHPEEESNIIPKLVPTQIEAPAGNEAGEGETVEATNEDEHEGLQDEEHTGFTVPTPSSPPRPNTEAEQRAKKLVLAEVEEERRQAKKIALRGIEEAVEFSELKEPWAELLVGVARLTEVRSSSQPESIRGKGVQREIFRLQKTYVMLRGQNSSSNQIQHGSIREDMKRLQDRCAGIEEHKLKDQGPNPLKRSERKKMVLDVYQHLVPNMVKLAKSVLKTRFIDNDLTVHAHKEIVFFLRLAESLVTTAREWEPEPELESGIKSIAIHSIAINAKSIVSKYEEVLLREAGRVYSERLHLKQVADLEKLDRGIQRRNAKINAAHRRFWHQDHGWPGRRRRWPETHLVAEQVIDIDDLDGIQSGDPPNSVHRLSQTSRARIGRQPTEDIPPPSQYTWTHKETEFLLNALQRFTNENRFELIIERYGGPFGILKNFDMDQIMAQARFLKESMTTRLGHKSPSDPQWGWLMTV
ncbi:uncharacterized protein A1O9_01267, partial [Exophiala aquamarina CBS 119918]